MSKGLLLIDGSNIAHASNCTQPLRVGNQPTQAIFGVLRTLRPMLNTYHMLTPVILWDGASWRRMAFEEYKANRNKKATTKHELEAQRLREELKTQLPWIKKAIEYLGVRQMEALNYEADDLAGMICERAGKTGKRVVMISGDKDWVQLLQPNAAWIDPIRDQRLTPKTLEQKLGWIPDKKKIGVVDDPRSWPGFIGVPSPRAWLEIKCLMGDMTDNIPGVGKVGPKTALDFIIAYGSFAGFMNQVTDKTIDVDKLPKVLRDLATSDEKQEIFRRNMRLMDLRTPERPEVIQLRTKQNPVDVEGFRKLCEDLLFSSICNDLESWMEPFVSPQQMKIAA